MKKRNLLLLVVFSSLLLVPDALTAAEAPRRIISLVPSLTREIYDLEKQELLVGVTKFRPDPAASKEVVGTLTELNFEKILTLKPDLVLAGKDCNARRDIEWLRKMGLEVEVFDACRNYKEICRNLLQLAAIVDAREKAETIIRGTGEELSRISSSIEGRPSRKVMFVVGSEPLICAGKDTFFNEFITLSGCTNVFADLVSRYPRVNREAVVVRNPDVIMMVGDMGSTDPGHLWCGMDRVSAVASGEIHSIDADYVCQPTPSMFILGLKAVVGIVHPGAV